MIVSLAVSAALLSLPLVGLADDATTTPDSTATTTDFSNFVGLQMPDGLQVDDSSATGVTGVSADGLLTYSIQPQYPNGPRLIKLDGSDTVYWVSGGNIKIPMLTRAVFLSYGNKDEDVQSVSQDEFDFYPTAQYIWLNGTGAIYQIDGNTKHMITSAAWSAMGVDVSSIINVNKADFNSYKTGSKITAAPAQ